MSLLILREFDDLYDACVSKGWVPYENTEDVVRIVSPGHLSEVGIVIGQSQIRLSVPIRCEGDPHATQYVTHHDDAVSAAKFGEMHLHNQWDEN